MPKHLFVLEAPKVDLNKVAHFLLSHPIVKRLYTVETEAKNAVHFFIELDNSQSAFFSTLAQELPMTKVICVGQVHTWK